MATADEGLTKANLTNDGEWEPLEGVKKGQVFAKNSVGHVQRVSLGMLRHDWENINVHDLLRRSI